MGLLPVGSVASVFHRTWNRPRSPTIQVLPRARTYAHGVISTVDDFLGHVECGEVHERVVHELVQEHLAGRARVCVCACVYVHCRYVRVCKWVCVCVCGFMCMVCV